MNQKRITLAGLFVMFLLSSPLHADSDGFYCTSKGYFAYDLRAAIRRILDPDGSSLSAPHVLRIVRLSQGIREAGEVGMKDFQVHELTCDSDRVTISGYDKGWLKYVVDISQPGQLRIIEHTEETIEQHPFVSGGKGPDQIIGLRPGQVVTLSSSDQQDTYQLVFVRSQKVINVGTNQRGIESDNRAELRGLDSHGTILQRLQFYHDRSEEFGE